jgi:hypothetical protein
MLKESWANDPYPSTGEVILLCHDSGLPSKHVRGWFERQRQGAAKRGEELFTRTPAIVVGDARQMWIAYGKDPEGYIERMCSGRICRDTGAIKED